MELIEDFRFLSIGIDKNVRNVQKKKLNKTIDNVETEEDYEKVCRARWPDCDYVKMILETRFSDGRKHGWKSFYETLDELPNKWKRKEPKTFSQEYVQKSKRTDTKRVKNDIDYEVRALSSGPVFVAAASRPALTAHPQDFRLVYRKVLSMKHEAWISTNLFLKDYQCSLWVACTLIIVDEGILKAIDFPSVSTRQIKLLTEIFRTPDLPKTQSIRMSYGVVMFLFVDNTIAFLFGNDVLQVEGDLPTNVFTIEADNGVFFAGTADGAVHRFALDLSGHPKIVKIGNRKYFEQGQIFIIAVSGNRISVATSSAIVFEQLDEDPEVDPISCYINTKQDPLVNVAYFGDLVVTVSINSFLTIAPFAEKTYFWKNIAPRALIDNEQRLVANQNYISINEEAVVILLPNGTLCFWKPQA